MLCLLATLAAPAIGLTLTVPKVVAPGEEVSLAATVTNRSKKPVTLIVVEGPFTELGMRFEGELLGPGGRLAPDSVNPLIGQWFRAGSSLDTRPFLTLKPGESKPLYRESFHQIFTDGKRPGLMAEAEKAPRVNLAPGRYRWRVVYKLTQEIEKRRSRAQFSEDDRPTFTPEAQRLFDGSWKGEVTAEATFEVRSKV